MVLTTGAWDGSPDIDDVATTLVAKLVRRHPHVFADAEASTPEEVEAQWAAIKAAEKAVTAGDVGASGALA